MSAVRDHRRGRLLVACGAAAFALAGAWILRAPPGRTTLEHNKVWSPQTEPLVISRIVVVPSNVTLTIAPGTTIHFRPRAGLAVAGRLIVEGSDDRTIRLARHPVSARLWAGISFMDSAQENRLRHVELEGAGSEGSFLRIERSAVTIEHVRFSGAERCAIQAADSSVILRHSVIEAVGRHEAIRATGVPNGGHFVVEDNVFFPARHDVVDIEACWPPGGTPRFVGNVFLGGGDDGLDLDHCEAWVEGNVFVDFRARHRDDVSYAISCSAGSQVVITNNLFVGNDQAVVSKRDSFVRLLNNTFYGTRGAAICFNEGASSAGGVAVANCVFWQNQTSFLHEERATQFTISNSILPEAARWPGRGNVASVPRFREAADWDFRLREDSHAPSRGSAISPAKFRAALRKRGQSHRLDDLAGAAHSIRLRPFGRRARTPPRAARESAASARSPAPDGSLLP